MQNNGFSMVEMLLVVVIMSVITMLTISFIPIVDTNQEIHELISNYIYTCQELSMMQRMKVILNFESNRIIATSNDNQLTKIELPNKLYFYNNAISFNSSGNIDRGNTIMFDYNDKQTRIIFQLGSGRFRFE